MTSRSRVFGTMVPHRTAIELDTPIRFVRVLSQMNVVAEPDHFGEACCESLALTAGDWVLTLL